MPGPDESQSALARRFARLPTGIKMLAIISLALVPLGLIALFASLQATSTADLQRRADLRVAVTESIRKLDTEIASDMTAMAAAVRMLEGGTPVDQVCGRLAAVLAARSSNRTPFALFGTGTAPVCAVRGFRPPRPPLIIFDPKPDAFVDEAALNVRVPSRTGNAVAVARYSAGALGEFARPTGYSGPFSLTLVAPEAELPLVSRATPLLTGNETYTASAGLLGLSLNMTVDRVPFSATEALLTFLPLLMWASAAAIGFLVVDRLLIRPLKALRASVAAYTPGAPFVFPAIRTPALEIRELAETFAAFGKDLAAHEADLARALAHQTKLTREVHHRVKNNLQVVASLISLHARGAPSPDAAEAYASIQRRVDALSIVFRNHYAELEENRGISIKALVGELAANLRASALPGAPVPPISVTAAPLNISQDSAVPIAFLLTELTELSMTVDPGAALSITVGEAEAGRALLTLVSAALKRGDAVEARLAARYGRVIEGLSRQLRALLDYDPKAGSYAITFPVFVDPRP